MKTATHLVGDFASIVFIGSDIQNYQSIVSAITSGPQVVVYDGASDGLRQIAEILRGVRDLNSVHIFSHGSPGKVQLGSTELSISSIDKNANFLSDVGAALSPAGQIRFYGCNVAAIDTKFLEAMKLATGRNVAASKRLVGATAFGGSWTLDASTGGHQIVLPASLAALEAFNGVLVTPIEKIHGATTADSVQVNGTATDTQGDLFVTGQYTGTVDFGGTSLTSSGSSYLTSFEFVARYDAQGNLQWVQSFDGNTSTAVDTYPDRGNAIAVSPDGTKIYVGGSFYGTLNFNSTHAVSVGDGYSGSFIAQLNGSGDYQWSTNAYGSISGTSASVVNLSTDAAGNLYAIENYASYSPNPGVVAADQVVLHPASGSAITLDDTNDRTDALIFKADATGAIQWQANVGGAAVNGADSPAYGLAVDSANNVYVTGSYYNSVITSANGSSASLSTGNSQYGSYLAKFNSAGNYQWSQTQTVSSNAYYQAAGFNAVAVDQFGPVVTGAYTDNSQINGQTYYTATSQPFPSSPQYTYSASRAFVEQLDVDGSPLWIKTEADNGTSASSADEGTKIVVDKAGNVIVGGTSYSPNSTANNFDGASITPVAGHTSGFIWAIAPGSSGSTNYVGSIPTTAPIGNSQTNNISIGGLFEAPTSGVILAINADRQTDVNPGSGVTNVNSANLNASPFVALSGADLNEALLISVDSVSAAEGNAGTTPYTFTVSLSGPSAQTTTVAYQTSDGTATTADGDYTAASGILTFAPGVTTQTVAVAVNGDAKYETDESFNLLLSSPTNGATFANNSGVGTIINDDALPAISIDNVSQAEGNAGSTAQTFTVSLSAASSLTTTVNYATADATAKVSDGDYTATSGTLTFAPGETSKSIAVQVDGDNKYENDESFFVDLTGLTNATYGNNQGVGTIVNDDTAPTISVNDISHAEGDTGTTTAYTFSVGLSAASALTTTVNYATADGTATAGSDYAATSGALSFAPGETTKTVTVLANGDTDFEPDETFDLNLSAPTNAIIGVATGVGTIANDDAPPDSGGGGGSSTTPTSGADLLTGLPGDSTIAGLEGDDTISGMGGNDLLFGNQGTDSIDAGDGNNTVAGGQDDDSIAAGAGNDLLFGNQGSDTISAGDGNNTVVGGQDSTDGSDIITTGSGNDLILGNGGNDTISAGGGNDSVVGGAGDDLMLGNQGDDIVYGNRGDDIVYGGAGDDTLVGGMGDDTLVGGLGNDVLYGNKGADIFVFGTNEGADIVQDFSVSDGDKLALGGQTYTLSQDNYGSAVLTLSGGGSVTLSGISPNDVNVGFFA